MVNNGFWYMGFRKSLKKIILVQFFLLNLSKKLEWIKQIDIKKTIRVIQVNGLFWHDKREEPKRKRDREEHRQGGRGAETWDIRTIYSNWPWTFDSYSAYARQKYHSSPPLPPAPTHISIFVVFVAIGGKSDIFWLSPTFYVSPLLV